MRTIAVGLVVIAFTNAYAWGGTISFTPDKHEIFPVHLGGTDSTVVTFDLALASINKLDGGLFDGMDAVVGSNEGLLVTDWVFNTDTIGACAGGFFCGVFNPGPGKYDSDIKFGFFSTGALTPSWSMGTLTVDANTLPVGSYQVVIDAASDQQSFAALGLPVEGLFGVGTVNIVVPEPATMTLLGLASLALIRRRRKA